MNAVAAAASRLERWDRRGDWRRFWWALPTVVLGLGIWGGVVGYHHFADAHLVVVSEVIPETFTTGAAPTIVIVDRAGDIRVDAGASASVAVSVTRLGAGKTTDAAMDDLTSLSLHMDDRQGMVQIVTGEEPGKTTSSEARSTIHVTAPTGSRLSIVTHEGSVVVAGLAGDIAATADHGDVRVELGETAIFSLFDGAGSLHSDFPLATPPAGSDPEVFAVTGDGNGNALDSTGHSIQQLDLHAPNGNVVIQRR